MDENLITKKELLDLSGISYGSLYRWKRKNLIPDEWFIHRATFTGQETFFPKSKILERIKKIIELKEEMSLDDIAETLDPSHRDVSFTVEEIEKSGVASRASIDIYLSRYDRLEAYDFDGLLSVYLFGKLVNHGALSRDDIFLAFDLYLENKDAVLMPRLVFIRKLGICVSALLSDSGEVALDAESTLILDISIQRLTLELKELLGEDGKNERQI